MNQLITPHNAHPLVAGLKTALPPQIEQPEGSQLVQQVLRHYHKTLGYSERARAFLKKQYLIQYPEMLNEFEIGFVDRSLPKGLPDRDSQPGAAIRGALQRIGLLRDTGHEWFRGALTVPIKNQRGDILGVYGHWIGKQVHREPESLLWMPSRMPIFNETALHRYRHVVICPDPLEALMLINLGFPNVIAILYWEKYWQAFLKYLRKTDVHRLDLTGSEIRPRLDRELGQWYRWPVNTGERLSKRLRASKTPKTEVSQLLETAVPMGVIH